VAKRYGLVEKSKDYSLKNLAKGYLPQINIKGQATYQSDVTTIPIALPGVEIPQLSKDQYKVYAEVLQPIYDGGRIKQQKKLQEAHSALATQEIAVQLYQLKDRVNQLFFGILLLDLQLKQNELTQQDIQLGLDKANAAIRNGVALKSSAAVLEAELLKAGQQAIELEASRTAFTDMLSLLVHRPLDEHTVFVQPSPVIPSLTIKRPELAAFDYQNKALDAQYSLLSVRNRPRLNFFVQGGYGRPALNMFENSFAPYYIGGLQLSIPITGFYTLKNEKALIDIQKENLAVAKETFLFNTHLDIKQQNTTIVRLQALLEADEKIIPLRTNIKKTALAQLENGVAHSSDYLREVHAESQARQAKALHEIQLLLAEYTEQTTTGN
jgi:outer membrane protein TolC